MKCDCIDLCELSGNASLTLGNGRRGSGMIPKSPGLDAGLSAEGKIALNICTGKLSGEITLVASIGLTGKLNIFGFEYEPEINYNYVKEVPLGDISFDSLKLVNPC